MESEIYKQTKRSLLGEDRSDFDFSDEEHVHCENCEADDSENYSFYRRESFGKKDGDSMRCSRCDAHVRMDTHRTKRGKKDNKLRWADECNKELTRQHPRKRYTKKPLHSAPLKPILKSN